MLIFLLQLLFKELLIITALINIRNVMPITLKEDFLKLLNLWKHCIFSKALKADNKYVTILATEILVLFSFESDLLTLQKSI